LTVSADGRFEVPDVGSGGPEKSERDMMIMFKIISSNIIIIINLLAQINNSLCVTLYCPH
jgi:hypothetical protein